MMDELLNILRLSGIFSPNGAQPQPMDERIPSIAPPDQMQMAPMSHQANDQYRNYLNQIPNQNDYHPSKLRQIAGAIANLGSGGPAAYSGGAALGYKSNIPEGLAVQDKITNARYYRDEANWNKKLKPLSDMADNENTRNSNDRLINSNILSNKLNRDKLDSLERDRDTKNDIAQQKADTSASRAKAYVDSLNFKTQHPTMKSFIDDKGMIVFIDPTDPTKHVATGIKSDELSDIEKINLGIQGRIQAIGAQGAQQRSNEDNREVNREKLENQRYPNGRPSGNTDDVVTETNVTTEDTNKDGNDDTRHSVVTKRKISQAKPTGKIKMRAPNGQIKEVDPSQVEHYKKLGAVEVK